jgi:hypothetical protein
MTGISGLFFGVALLFFAYKIGPGQDVYPVTYIICIAGCILGWVIGMISSPYNEEDKSKLNNFSKLIGTFLSGYILSKFDKVIETIVNPTTLLSQLVGLRVLLFICFFGIMWVVVFAFRRYSD